MMFLDFIIHFINYFFGFLGEGVDYLIYGILVAACICGIQIIKKGHEQGYKGVAVILKLMTVLYLVETLISVTMTERMGLALILIILVMLLKMVLDYFLFWEIIENSKTRKHWIAMNLAIIVGLALGIKVAFFEGVTIVLIVFRFLSCLWIIRNRRTFGTEKESFWSRLSSKKMGKKSQIIAISVVGAALIVFCFLRFYKPEGRYEFESNDGNTVVFSSKDWLYSTQDNTCPVKQYVVCNYMPEWSGFHREWWGLIDLRTGRATDARYRNRLDFDEDGIAWDYNGHFIDLDGNIIITVPSSVTTKRSAKTSVFNIFMGVYPEGANLYWQNSYAVESGNFVFAGRDLDFRRYFWGQTAIYYSDVEGAFGIINDKGQIVVKPEIINFNRNYNEGITSVVRKQNGYANFINDKGEYLFDKSRDYENLNYNHSGQFVSGNIANTANIVLADYDGNLLDGDDSVMGAEEKRGDIITKTKHYRDEEGNWAFSKMALSMDGKLIYESDRYSDYYAFASSEGRIKYLMAKVISKSDNYWDVIDLESNETIYEELGLVVFDDNEQVAIGRDKKTYIVIVDFDGNILRTDYDGANESEGNYYRNDKIIAVHKEGENKDRIYNYMDLEGNLLNEEFTELFMLR
jgi:hypothetical protein